MQEEIEEVIKKAHQQQGYSLWDIKDILQSILKDVEYEIEQTKQDT